jgi:serine/alanine adding enzyme
MSITIVNTLPEEEWRHFVDEHPAGNVFHTPEMFQVFGRTKGYRPEIWAATEDRRVLALFVPVRITLMNGLLRHFTTRSVAYGSVLCAPDSEGQAALALLLETYTHEVDRGLLFTELRNWSSVEAVQPILQEQGFVYEDHLNYLIDLKKPIEAIFRRISKSGRKAIVRSMRGGVTPEEVQDRSLLPIYYELLRQSHKRHSVPLADISLFEAAFDILVPRGMAKMLLARVDDRYAAASLEVPFKDVIFSWYSGYDRAFRTVYPNDRLVWHILEWGAKNDYRCFDFGGAGRSGEPYSVRDFKAKFGGELVNYGRNVFVHTPLVMRSARTVYQFTRRILF